MVLIDSVRDTRALIDFARVALVLIDFLQATRSLINSVRVTRALIDFIALSLSQNLKKYIRSCLKHLPSEWFSDLLS